MSRDQAARKSHLRVKHCKWLDLVQREEHSPQEDLVLVFQGKCEAIDDAGRLKRNANRSKLLAFWIDPLCNEPQSLVFSGPSRPVHLKVHTYYPGQKKEPSSRFAARRTLFHVWYHARSGAISAGQKSQTVVDRTCPALIAPDRAWYHTWNSVLLAANLDDGSFFLSRVVVWSKNVREGWYDMPRDAIAQMIYCHQLIVFYQAGFPLLYLFMFWDMFGRNKFEKETR